MVNRELYVEFMSEQLVCLDYQVRLRLGNGRGLGDFVFYLNGFDFFYFRSLLFYGNFYHAFHSYGGK
jgi:hypothetical protein